MFNDNRFNEEIIKKIAQQAAATAHLGKLNDFIPALAQVDPDKFGVSIQHVDGSHFTYQQSEEKFSIQSVSKLYAMLMLMQQTPQMLWQRVGYMPSVTDRFDSIAQLDTDKGIPRYPFLNSAALVMTDMLMDLNDDPLALMLTWLHKIPGIEGLGINEQVAESEYQNSGRNRAIAHYLQSHKNLHNDVEKVLLAYCRLCAIEMSCSQLVKVAHPFACQGVSENGERFMSVKETRFANQVTQICGLYGDSLQTAVDLGLSAKSGSGGGIVAVSPNHYSIAVWSPPLGESGNSVAGMQMLKLLTEYLDSTAL